MRNLILPFIAVAVLAAGCSKQAEVIDPNTNNAETRVVGVMPEAIVFSDATLSFASMEALEAQVEALAAMSIEEKAAWYAAYPEFVSMGAAAGMINAQMREVGTKEGALEMRKSYVELFLFDPNTEVVNGTPYYKVSKLNYAMVCNAYGDVTVGGAVVNLNDLTAYEQTWYAKAMDETVLARSPRIVGNKPLYIYSAAKRALINVSIQPIYPINGQYIASLIYESHTMINDNYWLKEADTFSVMYEPNVTGNNPNLIYSGIYLDVRNGGVAKVYTTTGNTTNEKVCTGPRISYTGFRISSQRCGEGNSALRTIMIN